MSAVVQQLERAGNAVMKVASANVALALVISGIQCFMCIYTLVAFLRTPASARQGRLSYIMTGILIFVLYSFAASLDSATLLNIVFASSTGRDILKWSEETSTVDTIARIVTTLYIAVGDGLLLYRCYMILVDAWWLVVLPTLTYITMIDIPHSDVTYNMAGEGARVCLSVATNVLITVLISTRLIRTQRRLARALPSQNLQVYRGITNILIESALPLTVFGLCYAVVALMLITPGYSMQGMLNLLIANHAAVFPYHAFAALSPQMIIFSVTTGRSWEHSTAAEVTSPIAFAHTSSVLRSQGLTESREAFQSRSSIQEKPKLEV
ncbi:hypothetical protein FA15DRAFT_690795 [Coprinopsis marcescibilis]|uniref:G protein-coupled receptor n=1 Tax=Coprinopsis marcescibilis TaxID=230819 RepID=A0A5C3LN61_COPMA|nr:hypothetical protein FA15DRAFT_690795 [Coprinopsis marcescibilis]